jgi:hypothetical protein
MAPLRPCPGCSRHVRVSEPACPFCAGELDDAFRSIPSARALSVRRLSRAALFALGASGLAATTACGSGTGGSGTEIGGEGGVTMFAPYGAPPSSSGFIGVMYGAPACDICDAGTPVATLCGDPVCPPLPGEDASADGSTADGAGGSDSAPSDAAVSDADGASDAADSGDAPRD